MMNKEVMKQDILGLKLNSMKVKSISYEIGEMCKSCNYFGDRGNSNS